jgi:hypothetical protein
MQLSSAKNHAAIDTLPCVTHVPGLDPGLYPHPWPSPTRNECAGEGVTGIREQHHLQQLAQPKRYLPSPTRHLSVGEGRVRVPVFGA